MPVLYFQSGGIRQSFRCQEKQIIFNAQGFWKHQISINIKCSKHAECSMCWIFFCVQGNLFKPCGTGRNLMCQNTYYKEHRKEIKGKENNVRLYKYYTVKRDYTDVIYCHTSLQKFCTPERQSLSCLFSCSSSSTVVAYFLWKSWVMGCWNDFWW